MTWGQNMVCRAKLHSDGARSDQLTEPDHDLGCTYDVTGVMHWLWLLWNGPKETDGAEQESFLNPAERLVQMVGCFDERGRIPDVRHGIHDMIARAFEDCREQIFWIALLLTGSAELANTCVLEARTLANRENNLRPEHLERCARFATIRSAAGIVQPQLKLAKTGYEQWSCPHTYHPALSREVIDLIQFPDAMARLLQLDAVCRFALVLRGIEGYTTRQSAFLLNMSSAVIEAAFCTAMAEVEAIACEALIGLEIERACN